MQPSSKSLLWVEAFIWALPDIIILVVVHAQSEWSLNSSAIYLSIQTSLQSVLRSPDKSRPGNLPFYQRG